MRVYPSISGKPMRKDASCINILTCEHYLKCLLSEVPYAKLFDGITGNKRFLVTNEETGKIVPVTKGYLLDARNWISNQLLSAVYRNTIAILNDPSAIYNAGRLAPRREAVDRNTQVNARGDRRRGSCRTVPTTSGCEVFLLFPHLGCRRARRVPRGADSTAQAAA